MKPQVINIEDRFDSLRHFDINSAVINKNSWINEIRLPFDLAAAQAGQNAVRLN